VYKLKALESAQVARTFLFGLLCISFLGAHSLAQAAQAKGTKVGFANYIFKTLPKPTKVDADKLYKLVEKAQGFRDKKAIAKAKAALKKLTYKDIPAMFRVMERRSDAKKYFFPLFVRFGSRGLVAVDILLAEKSGLARHYSYSRRDAYLKGIGEVCARFGKKALPALKASLVSSKQYQRRAAAWGLALMGKAAIPTIREALASPRTRERMGALYVLRQLKEKEAAPFAKGVLQALKTTHSLKDLSYLKYSMRRLFVIVLPKMGPSVPGEMVAILSNPKASTMERYVAPKVLKKLGPKAKSVLNKILPMLSSKTNATQALGVALLTSMKMKLPKAYPALLKLVTSAKEPLRSQAAKALFFCGDSRKASVVTVTKALGAALKGLTKGEQPYSKAVTHYLDGMKLLKKEAALPGKGVLIQVLSHPKSNKGHVMRAVSVLSPFAKQAKGAVRPLVAVMKRLKFYSYETSALVNFLLATGKGGFKAALPHIKKSIKTGSSYGLSGIFRNLKKVGADASVLMTDVLARGARESRGSTKKDVAQAIAWMAPHQPKLFAQMTHTQKLKERELILMAISSQDKLLKLYPKVMHGLLKQAFKEQKTYHSDTMMNVMDSLRKRSAKLLLPLRDVVKPFRTKSSFMGKIYAKYVLKKIDKALKK